MKGPIWSQPQLSRTRGTEFSKKFFFSLISFYLCRIFFFHLEGLKAVCACVRPESELLVSAQMAGCMMFSHLLGQEFRWSEE